VLKALYCVAPWCLQRGATSEAGEEVGPPGPRGFLIEVSANIVVKAGNYASEFYPSSSPLAARGLPLLL
jgi:hypothetical protein